MSVLFSPIAVKNLTFKNRVVMPPMVCAGSRELADPAARDGVVGEADIEHYGRRARAGTGLIIVEATAVDEGGRCWKKGLCAYSDEHLPGLRRLAERIRAGGAIAGIQLVHGGPQGSPELAPDGLVGPSEVAPSESHPGVRELTAAQIQRIEQCFEQAAVRVVQAGFRVVELHGAHGFLLDSFLLMERNRRTDEYGGSLEGRMRMLLETCRRVKQRIGNHALLDCRISIFNKREEGFSAADLKQLVGGLGDAGIDLLHISTDGAFKGYFGSDRTIGHLAKEMTGLPIIVAGGLGDPADAERAVAERHADFAAVGTAMLKEADWTRRAAEKLGVSSPSPPSL
jgi:2,4-dienoyl-CoA reductase-like NADH-dependent reductase (Old Yellow Enzyme family)